MPLDHTYLWAYLPDTPTENPRSGASNTHNNERPMALLKKHFWDALTLHSIPVLHRPLHIDRPACSLYLTLQMHLVPQIPT